MPHFPPAPKSDEGQESSDARSARILIKTRRRRYLELNPTYFDSPSLELAGAATRADPLLYDRMIRRFQSAVEREADGREKGYSGMLEADLMRSEAKMDALNHPDPNSPLVYRRDASGAIVGVEQDEEDRPKTKEEGIDKWREVMEHRFLRGEDKEFDYKVVDEDDSYDDWEWDTRNRQEQYFDGEEEEFVGEKTGETGVQDF